MLSYAQMRKETWLLPLLSDALKEEEEKKGSKQHKSNAKLMLLFSPVFKVLFYFYAENSFRLRIFLLFVHVLHFMLGLKWWQKHSHYNGNNNFCSNYLKFSIPHSNLIWKYLIPFLTWNICSYHRFFSCFILFI